MFPSRSQVQLSLGVINFLGSRPQVLPELCPIHVEGTFCVSLGISRGAYKLVQTSGYKKKSLTKLFRITNGGWNE